MTYPVRVGNRTIEIDLERGKARTIERRPLIPCIWEEHDDAWHRKEPSDKQETRPPPFGGRVSWPYRVLTT